MTYLEEVEGFRLDEPKDYRLREVPEILKHDVIQALYILFQVLNVSGGAYYAGESNWTLRFRDRPLQSAVTIAAQKNEGRRVYYGDYLDGTESNPYFGINSRTVYVVTPEVRLPYPLNGKLELLKLVVDLIGLEMQMASQVYLPVSSSELLLLQEQLLDGESAHPSLTQARQDLERGDVLDAVQTYLLACRFEPKFVGTRVLGSCQVHLKLQSLDSRTVRIHRVDQSVVYESNNTKTRPRSTIVLVRGLTNGGQRCPLLEAIMSGDRSQFTAIGDLHGDDLVGPRDIRTGVIDEDGGAERFKRVRLETHYAFDVADPQSVVHFLDLMQGWHRVHCNASVKVKQVANLATATTGSGVQKRRFKKDRKPLLQRTIINNANKLPYHVETSKTAHEANNTENMDADHVKGQSLGAERPNVQLLEEGPAAHVPDQ